jgi:hypothetical protein
MRKQKISEMVIDLAWDFIGQGSSLEERRNRLRSACTAWNYACVPERVGVEMLDKYMVEYRKWNPDADAEECQAIRESMEVLVREKLKKYPHVIKQIIACELTAENGQEQVYVVAVGETP